MNKRAGVVTAVSLLALAGCQSASITETWETKRSYATYHLQVQEHVATEDVTRAITTALQQSSKRVRVFQDLPPSPLPLAADRFTLFGPLGEQSNFSFNNDNDYKVPTCNGALVYAKATNDQMQANGRLTQLYTCLWQYQDGYHVDIYSQLEIRSRRNSDNAGTEPEARPQPEFVRSTISQVHNNLMQLDGKLSLVSEYPVNYTDTVLRQ